MCLIFDILCVPKSSGAPSLGDILTSNLGVDRGVLHMVRVRLATKRGKMLFPQALWGPGVVLVARDDLCAEPRAALKKSRPAGANISRSHEKLDRKKTVFNAATQLGQLQSLVERSPGAALGQPSKRRRR